MNTEDFKYKFWGIIMVILFFLTLYFIYSADKYFSDTATQPTSEEEKEDILEDYPEGVPTRFWN